MEVGDHIIQVIQFKYLGFLIQNDVEMKANVNRHIQVGWLKWRKASGVLCDANVLFKLKRKNINSCRINDVLWNRMLGV